MLEMYWVFFGCGVLFALVTVLFGDILQTDHLPFLQPLVIVGGVTIFGASGILFTKYSSYTAGMVLVFSLLSTLLVSLAMYFLYVKRMKNAETSIGFSIHDLTGKIGEVNTTIPMSGYGEVIVRIGSGLTNQIAASFDGETLPEGTKVVVVEVKEETLYVSRLESEI